MAKNVLEKKGERLSAVTRGVKLGKCRAITLKQTQCLFNALPGSLYCLKHSVIKFRGVPRYLNLIKILLTLALGIVPSWWFSRKGATAEDVQKVVKAEMARSARDYDKINHSLLRKNYPLGYAIFSVTETTISEEIDHLVEAKWNTARVESLTTNEVAFRLPDFFLNSWLIEGVVAKLDRKTGARCLTVSPGNEVWVEVLKNHQMGVTMVLGLRPIRHPR